ncbi:MAG TPA: hypothetical protein VM186_08545, partial [Planctomycetota bacterium]|nr:hypothetical protein [Planctomycetota bacterium]
GKPGPAWDAIQIGGVFFSPDSSHAAYVAAKGKVQRAVIDGKLGPDVSGVRGGSLIFSPDSKHYLYVCSKYNKHWFVIDGDYLAWDLVIPNPIFSADSSVEFLAGLRGKLYRVNLLPK